MRLNTNRLQELLDQKMYTKVEIADNCKLSRVTIDKVLARKDVKVSTLMSICEYIKKPISFFFDDEREFPISVEKRSDIIVAAEGGICGSNISGSNNNNTGTSGCPAPAQSDAVMALTRMVDQQRERIDYLTDKLLQLQSK